MLLVRMSLILFISLLLIIVGTLYLGYQQPDDTLLLDFQHCGDRVCVLGIAPNITPLDAALATLRSNPQLESPPDTPTQANEAPRSKLRGINSLITVAQQAAGN